MKYAKLRGLIRANYPTNAEFARAMGLSCSTISAKLCGKIEWREQEIVRACQLLGVPLSEAHLYFFAQ